MKKQKYFIIGLIAIIFIVTIQIAGKEKEEEEVYLVGEKMRAHLEIYNDFKEEFGRLLENRDEIIKENNLRYDQGYAYNNRNTTILITGYKAFETSKELNEVYEKSSVTERIGKYKLKEIVLADQVSRGLLTDVSRVFSPPTFRFEVGEVYQLKLNRTQIGVATIRYEDIFGEKLEINIKKKSNPDPNKEELEKLDLPVTSEDMEEVFIISAEGKLVGVEYSIGESQVYLYSPKEYYKDDLNVNRVESYKILTEEKWIELIEKNNLQEVSKEMIDKIWNGEIPL